MRLRAVDLDMDGVLVDSDSISEQNIRLICQRHELSVPDEVFASFRGVRYGQVFQTIVSQYGHGRLNPDDLTQEAKRRYRDAIRDGTMKLVPGARVPCEPREASLDAQGRPHDIEQRGRRGHVVREVRPQAVLRCRCRRKRCEARQTGAGSVRAFLSEPGVRASGVPRVGGFAKRGDSRASRRMSEGRGDHDHHLAGRAPERWSARDRRSTCGGLPPPSSVVCLCRPAPLC